MKSLIYLAIVFFFSKSFCNVSNVLTMSKQRFKGGKASKLYKTELCKLFEKTNSCKYGKACYFAHGTDELRCRPAAVGAKPSILNPSKSMSGNMFSRICDSVLRNNTCMYGDQCFFAHSKDELGMSARDVVDSRRRSYCSTTNDDTEEAKGDVLATKEITHKIDSTLEKNALFIVCDPDVRRRHVSVWESLPTANIYWGPVFRNRPLPTFRTFYYGLKPDKSKRPQHIVQPGYEKHYLQKLCPSLYAYVHAHNDGIFASYLIPRLREAFPVVNRWSTDDIIQCLTDCMDVWTDYVSRPGRVLILVN